MSSRRSLLSLFLFFLALLRPLTLQGMEGYEEIDDKSDSNVNGNRGAANTDRVAGSENISMTDNDTSQLSSNIRQKRANDSRFRSQEASQPPLITLDDFRNAAEQFPDAKGFIIKKGKLERNDNPTGIQNSPVRRAWIEALRQEYGETGYDLSCITEREQLIQKGTSRTLSAADIKAGLERVSSIIQNYDKQSLPTTRRVLASAQNRDEVTKWPESYEIRHDGEKYYAIHEKEMNSITEAVTRVLQRTAADRTEHRRAIDKLATCIGPSVQKRFATRKILGQPVTVGALNEFLDTSKEVPRSGTFQDLTRGIASLRDAAQHNSQRKHEYEEISDGPPAPPWNPFASRASTAEIPFSQSLDTNEEEEKEHEIALNPLITKVPEQPKGRPSLANETLKQNTGVGTPVLINSIQAVLRSAAQLRGVFREALTRAQNHKPGNRKGYTTIDG